MANVRDVTLAKDPNEYHCEQGCNKGDHTESY